MGGTLSPVAKGRLMRAIDTMLEQPQRAFLDELVNGTSMVDLGLDKQIISQDAVPHVTDEVFGDDGTAAAWWPSALEKEAIVRGGYIQALRVALRDPSKNQAPVPIRSYWITGVQAFEVLVVDTPTQVNVLLLTPDPAHAPNPRATGVQEDMWIVAPAARCQALFDSIPAAYGAPPPEDVAGAGNVKVLRLWGY